MTQEEIIRMAREAGIKESDVVVFGHFPFEFYQLERFAALVAAHEAEKWKAENKRDYENWKMAAEKAAECEREACAKMCEGIGGSIYVSGRSQGADFCAAAIRARGEK